MKKQQQQRQDFHKQKRVWLSSMKRPSYTDAVPNHDRMGPKVIARISLANAPFP